MIAAGGALGGLFVAVAAPLLFTDYYELHWGLFLCGLLFLLVCVTARAGGSGLRPQARNGMTGAGWPARWPCSRSADSTGCWPGCPRTPATIAEGLLHRPSHRHVGACWLVLVVSWIARRKFRSFQHWRFLTCAWLSLGLIGLGAILWMQAHDAGSERVYRSRNFYGVLTVYEHEKKDPESHYFLLQHGRITHGLQFVDPAQAMLAGQLLRTGKRDRTGRGRAARRPPAHRRGGSWHRHDGGVWPAGRLPALLRDQPPGAGGGHLVVQLSAQVPGQGRSGPRRRPALAGTGAAATLRPAGARCLQRRRHPRASADQGGVRGLPAAPQHQRHHRRAHLQPLPRPGAGGGQPRPPLRLQAGLH